MKNFFTVVLSIFCLSTILPFNSASAQDSLTIDLVDNYNDWGWNTWVMKNDLITVSTVPAIGARIMQYDLGDHPSLFINEDEFGNTYTPGPSFTFHNFGGFKNWPAPQERWNWPPPPSLDFGAYESTADTSADSVSLVVTSPVEQWLTPDLQFSRRTTMYKNTSRVKVEQTIINHADTPQSWSVWDVTQQITNHPGETDFENFWAYFPINPDSRYGASGVRTDGNSDAWVGEVAPGIYGVQYSPDSRKIFADSHIGWISYVDERDGYVYVKTFDIDEEAEYPDQGARVEVWVQNSPYYLETEVVSPIVELSPDGGNYTFTENWWAAKISAGPVLGVTNAGVVTEFEYQDTDRLIGSFGVFYNGFASLQFLNSAGELITESEGTEVTPLEAYQFDIPFSYPEDADTVKVVLRDPDQNLIGTLAAESIVSLTTSGELEVSVPDKMQLAQNYPNPFNPSTVISYQLAMNSRVELKVFDMAGREIAVLVNGFKSAGAHQVTFDASELASGVYLYRIVADGKTLSRKMVLIK